MKFTSTLITAVLAISPIVSAYNIGVFPQEQWGGTPAVYDTDGAHKTPFVVKSWLWYSRFNDGCCVRFCKGSTSVGYFCPTAEKAISNAGANKVVTGCGDNVVLKC